jgi:adenosylhomocysteinase
VRVTGSLHMTIQTAVLIETLKELGADVRWASCNIFSTQDHAAAAIAASGTPVFAWKGENLEEYWDCTSRPSCSPAARARSSSSTTAATSPLLIHKGYELEKGGDWVNEPSDNHEEQVIKNLLKKVAKEDPGIFHRDRGRIWKGVSEETTTGVHRLYQMGKGQAAGAGHQRQRLGHQVQVRQPLRLPRIAGRRHQARHRRDDRRQGRVVCGYGDVGKGCGALAARHGAQVVVTEIDPINALQAAMEGFEVNTVEDTLGTATSTSPPPATRTSSPPSTCRR